MEKLPRIEKVQNIGKLLKVEIVYPLAVLSGMQTGDVFVDNVEAPKAALIWHCCGFANLAGEINEEILEEIRFMMQEPQKYGYDRMVLHMEEESKVTQVLRSDAHIKEGSRYGFEYRKKELQIPDCKDGKLERITKENYGLLEGRIIPSFSWTSMEEFLEKGYGYCLMREGEAAACAFSSGVSPEYVDIGVETKEKWRGMGYAKIVAAAMVKETMEQGKMPVWSCDIQNVGSDRLARSLGFEEIIKHPYFVKA